MEIVLSGLDENACHELVGDTLWNHDSVRWLPPERFLDSATWQADGPRDKRLVWFYRSPVAEASRIASGSVQEDPDVVLDAWLLENRAALNFRRLTGHSMLMINVDRVSVVKLRTELGDTSNSDVSRTKPSDDVDPALTALLAHLFEWAGPRYCEVSEALEAACWPADDESEFLTGSFPDEAQLVEMLKVLGRGAALEASIGWLQDEKNKMQLHLHHLQEELERRIHQGQGVQVRKEAQETQQYQDESDAGNEKELLLTQLHQVQEELEAHYLSNVELRRQLSGEIKAAAASEGTIQALRLQMQQMHKELQRMAQVHAEAQTVPQVARSRLARFVPGRIRLKRERAQAERLLQTRLDAIGQSEWFDRQWYLETYPDVKVAGMDPVRHYVEFGWKEDRNPGPGFDTSYYLMSNVDVARSGLNPLLHFIEHGREEGRVPCEP